MTENNQNRYIIDVEESTQENAVFLDDEFICFEDDSEKLVEMLNDYSIKDNILVKDINKKDETIKELNQLLQDNEDCVSDWFFENWSKLDDDMRQSAHLELGIELEDMIE